MSNSIVEVCPGHGYQLKIRYTRFLKSIMHTKHNWSTMSVNCGIKLCLTDIYVYPFVWMETPRQLRLMLQCQEHLMKMSSKDKAENDIMIINSICFFIIQLDSGEDNNANTLFNDPYRFCSTNPFQLTFICSKPFLSFSFNFCHEHILDLNNFTSISIHKRSNPAKNHHHFKRLHMQAITKTNRMIRMRCYDILCQQLRLCNRLSVDLRALFARFLLRNPHHHKLQLTKTNIM